MGGLGVKFQNFPLTLLVVLTTLTLPCERDVVDGRRVASLSLSLSLCVFVCLSGCHGITPLKESLLKP